MIEALRKQKGYTIAKLAKELETSDSLIYKWESGFCKPSWKSLNKLAEILGNEVFDLYKQNTLPTTVVSGQNCQAVTNHICKEAS